MRVSSLSLHHQGLSGLLNAQAETGRLQNQIASGKRLQSPGDDPVAATRILKLDQEVAVREQYRDNIAVVEDSLAISEAFLDQTVNVLYRVRELTIAAGNPANTEVDRGFIAVEIEERKEELLGIMNSRNANGEYLFGGFSSHTEPFVEDKEGGFRYQGDQGQRSVQISATARVAVNDNGFDLFMDVAAARPGFVVTAHPANEALGNAAVTAGSVVDREAFDAFFPDDAVVTFEPLDELDPPQPSFSVRNRDTGRVVDGLDHIPYGSGQRVEFAGMAVQIAGLPQPGDIFYVETSNKQPVMNAVQRLEEGLQSIGDTAQEHPQLEQLLADSLSSVDFAIESVLETRADIGARLNAVASTRDIHERVELLAAEVRSGLEDLDYAEAVSALSFSSFVLEAAQQSFVRVQNLSLFNQI